MDVSKGSEDDRVDFTLNISSELITKKEKFKKKQKAQLPNTAEAKYFQKIPNIQPASRVIKSSAKNIDSFVKSENQIKEYDSGFDDINTSSINLPTSCKKVKFNSTFPKNEPHLRKTSNVVPGSETGVFGNFKKKKNKLSRFQTGKPFDRNVDGKKLQTSSLFKSNPDVPHVLPSKSSGKKELLFTNQTFEDLELHSHLVSCLCARFNVTTVTEVQGRTIPVLLKGKDALVKSCTGSGKTISYAVPIVQKLQEIRPKIQRSDGIYALVILPTRELVLQSFECFSNLTKAFTWIVPGYLIGGEKKKSEKARIRKGINILVCTPGRLLDHLEHTSNLNLKAIQWLVIDEADKLLEQGFEDSVLKILSHCSANDDTMRQTVLLSATLSKEVERLAGMSLRAPEYIDVADTSAAMEDLVVPSQLKQFVILTPTKLRLVTLSAFIVDKCAKGDFKALIFMCTQNNVDFHFLLFNQMLKPMVKAKGHRIKFFKLHGSMKQEDRTEVFNKFKTVERGILLCTDVASRGLDLPHVDWILQYSAPTSAENYVHRVGRTARIGKEGHSLLFLIPSEIKFASLLQKHKISMEEIIVKDVLHSLLLIADVIHETSRQPWGAKAIEEHATALHYKYEELVYSDKDLYNSAKDAFLSYVQAYSSYPKPLRPVIPFKMLHLGHVAKSFCLRESPSELGCTFSNPPPVYQKERMIKKRKSIADVSEFDSGLNLWKSENMPSKKRKKK